MSRCFWGACALFLSVGCGSEPSETPSPAVDQQITNRIQLSPEMMGNLGITFAEVDRGVLQVFLEVPGQLVAPSDRQWTVRAPSAGRVQLRVPRWAVVEPGQVVAELITPDLANLQSALFEILSERQSVAALREAKSSELGPLKSRAAVLEQAARDAVQRHSESEVLAEQTLSVAESSAKRVEELTRLQQNNALSNRELYDAKVAYAASREAALSAATRRDDLLKRQVDLQLEAVRAKNQVRTQQADMDILQLRGQEVLLVLRRRMDEFSALTGVPVSELASSNSSWQAVDKVELRSPGKGRVVDLLVGGGEWVGNAQPILQVVDPTELVFRGQVPESDLGRIPRETAVTILPAVEGSPAIDSELSELLPVADAVARTIQIEARIPNPDAGLPTGLSAVARVLLRSKARPEVLIPESCVARDGLEWVVFRRDPAEPGTVVRLPVEVGDRAGEIVEVISGLLEGDKIVQQGVHQLVHAGLGRTPPGFHIHADGTSHADHNDKK